MKKLLCISICSLCAATASHAATIPWLERPTLCLINPANCYNNMTNGYLIDMGNSETWDATSNCWGLKLICADALEKATGTDPVPMERADIAKKKNIRNDFDTDELSATGDCFGRRITSSDGSMAYVGNTYVPVWCSGILSDPDEFLENGEIETDVNNQPKCEELAKMGYAAVDTGKCYGKYYDYSKYFIECGSKMQPDRIIVLNGADANAPLNGAPATMADAEEIFESMYKTSTEQKKKYFEE